MDRVPRRALVVVALAIEALLPPDADKAAIGNKLREAARLAGCETPVVEMLETAPGRSQRMSVRCRDYGKEEGPREPDRR